MPPILPPPNLDAVLPADPVAPAQANLDELKRLAEELAARERQIIERERHLARSADESDLARTLDQREEALRVLAQRLLGTEERLVSMEGELRVARETIAAFHAGGTDRCNLSDSPASSEHLELRHRRLTRYKSLLNAQARKLMQARVALEKRHAEAEAVLSQRAKLAQASIELAAQKKAVAQRAARSSAAGMCFFILASLGVVIGLAYAVAGKMSPPHYAVRTVLAADPGDTEPDADELKSWTASHERILEDPELMVLAADRFGSRGMPELASPGAVNARFKVGQDFTYMTDRAGRLTIELRGQGAEATERQLETFALAAVALANARRDTRGDGLPTIVAEPPKAGAEPIKDDRLVRMATLSLPGMLIAGLLGWGLYRFLIGGQKNFEKHMAVVEATA
jgi:hypothetical protein